MQCKFCGSPIEDGSLVCSQCGAAAEQPVYVDEAPEVMPVSNEAEHDCCDRGEFVQMPQAAPGKSKKPLLIAIAAVALVVVIALVLAFSPLRYWIERSVTPADQLMVNAYTDGIHLLFAISENAQNSADADAREHQGTEGQVKIQLSEDVLDNAALAIFGGETDMSWLSEIVFDYDLSTSAELSQGVLGLSLGEHPLLSASLITDAEKLWIKIPELHEQALVTSLNMEEIVEDTGISAAAMRKLSISNEVMERIVVRYTEALLKGFANVTLGKETISAGDLSKDVTVLKAQMTEEELYNTLIGIIKMAMEDTDLKQMLTDAGIYENFITGAKEAVEYLEDSLTACDPEHILYLDTYLNSRNMLTGMKLFAADTTDKYSCVVLTENKQFAAEIQFADAGQLIGSGTLDTNSVSQWQLTVEGEKVLDIKLDITVEKTGKATGTATYEANMDGQTLTVKMDFVNDAESCQFNAGVALDGADVVNVICTCALSDAEEIVIPENAVDMNDDDAMLTWSSEMDMAGLIEALTEAGFPLELLFSMMYS